MTIIDWTILIFFFAWIIWDGIKSSKGTTDIEGLLLAKRSVPWWAVGLSVMATQASAISFIGTTGQAYKENMAFIQTYFGLPIAMIILSLTLVPFYNKLKVYTAYEALESKFGLKIRLATSLLFLLSRGLAMGTIIAAPAYVLSLIFCISLPGTILIIGAIATIYTTMGGIGGVIRTDIKQMIVMMLGLILCLCWIIYKMPQDIGIYETLKLSGSLGKLDTIDLSFDASSRYNIWSGIIAGMFLMLSYFGSDQTQVQRYLTAKSLNDARTSLMLTGVFKIPMMFLMLIIGALLYVFYIFTPPPKTFYISKENSLAQGSTKDLYLGSYELRKQAALAYVEESYSNDSKKILLEQDKSFSEQISSMADPDRDDTNYILPYFILNEMPAGLIGLIIAAIFAAALSSIDSGLNSLAATSVVDWLRRLHKEKRDEKYYLNASRLGTVGWGVFATICALSFGETGSIIELVNLIGSYFYGPILGIFALLFFNKTNGYNATWGLIVGFISVLTIDSLYVAAQTVSIHSPYLLQMLNLTSQPPIESSKLVGYLWLNPIGAIAVVGGGLISSLFNRN